MLSICSDTQRPVSISWPRSGSWCCRTPLVAVDQLLLLDPHPVDRLPLVESRSTTTYPLPCGRISAWLRLTFGSARTMLDSGIRPTEMICSRERRVHPSVARGFRRRYLRCPLACGLEPGMRQCASGRRRPSRPRPDRGTCSPRRGRALERRRHNSRINVSWISAKRSLSSALISTLKWFGITVRPRTSTDRLSSISRTIRRPSSTGRRPLRKARAKTPSTIRSRRRSNPDRPTGRHCRWPRSCSVWRGQPPDGHRPVVAIVAPLSLGRVAELADAQDSGSCVRKDVRVQVPPRHMV